MPCRRIHFEPSACFCILWLCGHIIPSIILNIIVVRGSLLSSAAVVVVVVVVTKG